MTTDTDRFELDRHARFRVVDDEGVFVLQRSSEVMVVNEVAAFVVEQLQKDRTVGQVVQRLTETFDVDVDTAAADTRALLESLQEQGALKKR